MMTSLLAVMLGGGIGSALRWGISNRLNSWFPLLPPGTLFANVLAGLLIGIAGAWFLRQGQFDPAHKLFITTGLCGGLSTFSTFSAEIVTRLQEGHFLWALLGIMTHVVLSLLAVFAGYALVNLLSR